MNSENNVVLPVRRKNLKVYYTLVPVRNGWNAKAFPTIRIIGRYLEKYNFNVGDTIEVSVGTGQITIKKVDNTPPLNNYARR